MPERTPKVAKWAARFAPRNMRPLLRYFRFVLFLFLALPLQAQTLEEILTRMMARNELQDSSLLEFRARRKFYAANKRVKTDSTMYVQTVFQPPDHLQPTSTTHECSTRIRSRRF